MPENQSATRSPSRLREKLEVVTFVRALLVTFLLIVVVVLNADRPDVFAQPAYAAILYLIVGTYVATVVFAVWLRWGESHTGLAYTQFVGDSILASGFILLVGGSESPFFFLFFLCMISSAFTIGRNGALFSASAVSVAYTLTNLSQVADLPVLSQLTVLLGLRIAPPDYSVAIHIAAFYTVAILAGQLADRLGQVDTELELRWTDIRRLRALNRNILNSISMGLCTLDLEDRIISFNQGAAHILGLQPHQVLSRNCAEVLPAFAQALERSRASSRSQERAIEVSIPRPDNTIRHLDVALTWLLDETGRLEGSILSFKDITEVRQLERIVKRQERMAAIGKLSAAIAHEIRNPLASISGSIQMLETPKKTDEKRQKRLMGIVVREVDRLNLLLEEFLEYAHPRPPTGVRINLRRLANETVELLRADTEHAHSLEFDLPNRDAPIMAYCDADKIRQVFWNLARNAAEAMNGRGTLRITMDVLPGEANSGPRVEIVFTDTGSGITPEVQERLFEPFFTTKSHGTGLGLATVHRIVELHGGMIWAEDAEAKKGAEFHVVLPMDERRIVDIQTPASVSDASVAIDHHLMPAFEDEELDPTERDS